jgi:gluconolactonase
MRCPVLMSGNGHINQLDPDGKTRIYRKGAGTNGLLFDRQGRLLACDSENRRMRVGIYSPTRSLREVA